MIVVIDGYAFDTDKAKSWKLSHWGKSVLYLSTRGKWYLEEPDCNDGRRWTRIMHPSQFLSDFRNYLTQDQIKEIITELSMIPE